MAPKADPQTAGNAELTDLLERAAELAAASGIAQEAFMAACWTAYLDARPGLREELENKELASQLKSLRKRGMIGLA